ncbi:hypothetical protein AAZX31_08G254900 [Glycine max]|uniref:F-box domain-containing protein n=2 Tax=Glycine subgen. Soja TaxID=1462606 RepID=I1KWU5_SOYBN|nr:F-box/kelch-repeat protein At3g23880 [Glycine max]XP_028245195.1 F-box/kelch-repeat protein At3g23880-like [Glycine soja]KAG4399573.1 hypothetical protein GLYMA_08G260800v4 [Glycine max]KAG5001359.1 hypothetical protein JHK87_022431 [Glycine soja]KAG5026621.1 hypothetical protein JHK86_022535 [Glycine max]KAG5137790.1 hypothetical protein JHK82_022521 [Glycine max]KHN19171.1 F-box protein CPR30 [Glycine soja]|eukprot:XP_006585849.1 F-box/kelch-repeat protein At3g23880 [Glycine max]
MAAAASPVLPQELIVEILSWLPVKPLMRFRCVSKAWYSLIFHPSFIKLHLQRLPKNTHVLLTFDNYECVTCFTPCSIRRLLENPSSTVIDGCHRFKYYNFVFGVCNGLVCLFDSSHKDGFEEYRIRIWNPATRIMSEDFPRLRLHSNDCKVVNYRRACEYTKFGFGYDDLSDTYKVVVILLYGKSQQREVRVRCLGDPCWRKILTCPAFPILKQQLCGQFVDDTVNWLALRRPGSDYQWETVAINELVIFSYDLKKETYGYVLMPDGLSEVPVVEPCLGVLKGCLCLSHDQRRTHFVVWLTREFGVERSWTRLLNVSYEHFRNHGCPPYYRFVTPLCMSENEDVLLLANDEGSEFVFYNLRDNRIDRIQDFDSYKFSFLSHDYVPSLVLPYKN